MQKLSITQQIGNFISTLLLGQTKEILIRTDEGMKHLNKTVDAVRVRLDKVDARLVKVELKLENVDTRLVAVESRLGNVELRLGTVERKLDGVELRLGQVEIGMA